ncbi:MAG: elongation factor G [Pirellulaceae bacterium]|nr:elongation factor G [Planctomycetales bacterium]
MTRNVADIRNIALVGHGSSGKTTLADQILVRTGAVNANPNVDEGTSICDFDDEEKHHKYSIEASITHFEHSGKFFNMIDCPGYPDLIGQTISALRAADTAIVAIDAHAGIKVNTRRVWAEATKAGCGKVIVITKLDTENIDFPHLIDTIKEVFGAGCVPLNVPIGHGHDLKGVASTLKLGGDAAGALIDPASINESLIESIIEVDDELMEKYFEGEVPSDEQLARLMVQAISAGTLTPILCVSTRTNVGVAELLDFLATSALPPTAITRTGTKDGAEVEVVADPAGPLVAQVFKTRIDPFVQKLSYVRVYSGTLKKDATVAATGARKGIKVSQLLSVQANQTHATDAAGPGEIVAIAKSEELHTGSSLGDIRLAALDFPRPMVGLAVTPKSRGDEAKLSTALHKITEEDSTVHVDHDPETKEMVLTGMSELHLTLLRERLKRRDKVEVDTHEPKIPYRETIQGNAEGSYRHKKQSGGSGQFAEVHIRMYPFPEGTAVEDFATKERFPSLKSTHYHEHGNFLWVDSVVGGSIPGNFMPAIEKGFLERLKQGVIAGFPIQNVCAEVHFGKDHPVDSNETAFRIAGSRVFSEVFQKARPTLLEPVVNLHITVPAGNVGDVSSDLSGRRGQMVGMESAGGGMTTVEARAPLSEVSTYARTLSSMTGGQGSYTMEFSHYDIVPPNVQQDILSKVKLREEEE